MDHPHYHPPVEPLKAWLSLGLSCVIPGAGFMACGRWTRGLVHFAIVMCTFVCGLLLHSSVAWPVWTIKSEEFNLINNFTFIVQMGAGVPAWASLFAAISEVAQGGAGNFLAGIPKHPYYELGGYFLIVAGAMNYFAIGNFYDRVVHVHPRFVAQETGGESEVAAS